MLQTFTAQTFSPHIGDTFRVFYDDSSALEMTLLSATEYGSESAKEWSKKSQRTPFTLIFVGPPTPILPQRIYRLEQADMDPFELFLLPVGPGEQGMRYEAIFT